LKILLTVHQFFPNYFSGTEVLTFSVGKELLRRGHEVAVLTGFPAARQLDDSERFDEYALEGLQVFRFHHAFVPMGEQEVLTELEYDNHLAAQYFAEIVQRFKPDIIHFFHLSRLGGRLIDVAVNAGVPAYYTPTDFWSVCPTSQLLLHGGKVCPGPTAHAGNCVKHVGELTRGKRVRHVTRLIPDAVADIAVRLTAQEVLPPYPLSKEIAAMSRRKDFLVTRVNWLHGVVSPTQLMTDVLTRNGVDPNLVLSSGYGIDIAGYDIAPPERTGDKPLNVGFIGTLAPHKGAHVLIEAFKRLPTGKAHLKIYGNPADFPDYYTGLEKRAGGNPAITFCGTFPNTEMGKVLAGIDVLVVPSLWYENAPLVVYSSLAAKRPVIASDFPGLSETIKDSVNGMIFPPGDAEALHGKLARFVNEPSLLSHLSANCRPPKSTSSYVDELEALYRNGLPTRTPVTRHQGLSQVAPLVRADKRGSLAGWAVMDFDGPRRVALYAPDGLQGETTRFQPRFDVRDGLRRGGANVKASGFGFVIKLPDGIDRITATLDCEAQDGRRISVALRTLTAGSSVHLGGGDYIAIDSERLIWQSGEPAGSSQ
jgi:glycosyltransferase involved in cell wall biosynthesis